MEKKASKQRVEIKNYELDNVWDGVMIIVGGFFLS